MVQGMLSSSHAQLADLHGGWNRSDLPPARKVTERHVKVEFGFGCSCFCPVANVRFRNLERRAWNAEKQACFPLIVYYTYKYMVKLLAFFEDSDLPWRVTG